MSGISFDHITQEVLKQQQLMKELEEENRELRRQLADLRAGHGIFIEIAGQRFPLGGEMQQPVTTSTVVQEDQPVITSSLKGAPITGVLESEPVITENEEAEEAASTVEEAEKWETPTFLEEIMLNEFAAAATSPMAVRDGPVKKQETESIDEKQKATLRRELMDSFLLE
jgi:hypothetical protein